MSDVPGLYSVGHNLRADSSTGTDTQVEFTVNQTLRVDLTVPLGAIVHEELTEAANVLTFSDIPGCC